MGDGRHRVFGQTAKAIQTKISEMTTKGGASVHHKKIKKKTLADSL